MEPRRGELRRLGLNLGLTILLGIAAVAAYLVGLRVYGPLPPLEFQLVEAGIVVLIGYAVARSFASAIRGALRSERTSRHAVAVGLFVDAVVGVAVVLALLHIFGVSLESVFLGSAFAAIVIGLAGQTLFSNIFAGFMIVLGRPFVIGQRVSFVAPGFGVIWPTYPHEMSYPYYTGVVVDIELLYTVLRMDDGREARVPSSIALTSLVVRLDPTESHLLRVRVTLPHSVPPSEVEAALTELQPRLAPEGTALVPPSLTVADVSPTTWDAVATIWTRNPQDEATRDLVLRRLLHELRRNPAAGAPGPS